MNDTVNTLLKIIQVIQDLKVNPYLIAVTPALGAAWLEQKFTQRKTPRFTTDHQFDASQSRRHDPR